MKIQLKEMSKMKFKSTSDLLKELSATENFDEFAKENKDYMIKIGRASCMERVSTMV